MAPQTHFWDRLQEEVRTGYERTRRTTRRAVQIGILRVDLLSLRRDRTRALAQLGERAFTLWNSGALGTLEEDPDALQVRTLLEGIERCIASKESELAQLRKEAGEENAARSASAASSGTAGEAPSQSAGSAQ